jgi:ligand-binding sensor domain-containing protein/signal transduction histidine kinase
MGVGFCSGRAGVLDSELEEPAEAIHVWRSADGLPSDSVTALMQTRDGFLWIGSSAGLVRFDGASFTQVQLPFAATNGPLRITALCEDSNGYVWVGTQQAGLFELAHGTTRRLTSPQGLSDDNITSLAADSQGAIWVGSRAGLSHWTGDRLERFTTRDGLPDEFVSGVNVARSGTVWITTRVGMCRFINGHIAPYVFKTESQGRSPEYLGAYEDRRGNLWAFGDTYLINLAENKRFNYFRGSESSSVRIWSLCEGQGGRLWIGTSGRGLFCFEENRFQPVVLGEDRSSYDVRAICEDREGSLWLGTSGGGLVQLRPQSVHVVHTGQGLPDSPPTALALDGNGRICVGLQRGGLFVAESGRFENVSGSDGRGAESYITSVCLARDGTLWVATLGDGVYGLRNGRGVHFTTANGLADDQVLGMCADREDGVWASTSAGPVHHLTTQGVTRLDGARGLSGAPVTTLIPSASGGIWLGTQDGRILREQNGAFTGVETVPQAGEYPVLALFEGVQGRLWSGAAGGGLTCRTDGRTVNWKTDNGLPSDSVAAVVEDDAKNLWIATGAGIYRIKRNDLDMALDNPKLFLPCQQMSEAKTRLESSTISGGTRAVLAPNAELWFATSEGVLKVDVHPTGIESSVFPVWLETAAFNGDGPIPLLANGGWAHTVSTAKPFKGPVDLRSLDIHFTALSFVSPGDLRFRHRLEGSDPDWVEAGVTRSAHYGRLGYGLYRFQVAARGGDGVWREAPTAFAFEIPTPLYLQAWALSLYGLAAVALVAGTVRGVSHRRLRSVLARLEQQQTLERERMRIARDMHDEIGSKLTKISFLSEHARMDSESLPGPLAGKIQSIAQFSQDLLKTMDEIVWVVNPRNDTLENLANYLSHYAVEYFQNTSIDCQLRLPQEIPHQPLSSETRHNLFLSFEEALNNVLKHSAATAVRVEMSLKALEFEILVADNGKGFEVPAMASTVPQARGGRGGNGLRNMRQRLAAIGGDCLLASRLGNGTTVTLRIRLTQEPPN